MALGQEVTEQFKSYVPSILSGISLVGWILILIVLLSLMTAVLFIVMSRKQYKYKIVLWEDIGEGEESNLIDVGNDHAMEVDFGDLGMRLLYWKKNRIYTAFPEKRTQDNKFHFKRNKNTGVYEPVIFKGRYSNETLKIEQLQSKVLAHNVGIRKGLKEEFKKSNWFKENAVMLISITFIMVLGVIGWLIMDKFLSISSGLSSTTQSMAQLVDKVNVLMDKADKLQASGHLVPVGG